MIRSKNNFGAVGKTVRSLAIGLLLAWLVCLAGIAISAALVWEEYISWDNANYGVIVSVLAASVFGCVWMLKRGGVSWRNVLLWTGTMILSQVVVSIVLYRGEFYDLLPASIMVASSSAAVYLISGGKTGKRKYHIAKYRNG